MEFRFRLIDLFWSRVTHGPECWEHSGSIGSHGYPQATSLVAHYSEPAHRVALTIALGRPLARGEFGLHKCNNRKCVRVHPEHVYVGDHKQNMDDMAAAGHPNRKLTERSVLDIRERIAARSATVRALAREFGVSQRAVQNIARGLTYRHVGRSR